VTKTNKELGYVPVESFEHTGIKKTVEWYLGNEDWWIGLLENKGN
jgi:dTDP-glucose 4,6-dehydratase